jgi:hypothetical protein
VQLKHQDGFELPPALRVILRTRPRFSTQLQSLMKDANENKGLSELHIIDPLFTETSHHDVGTEGTLGDEVHTEHETTEHEATLPEQLAEVVADQSLHGDDGDADHVDINQEQNEDIDSNNYETEEYMENGNGENEENGELIASANERIGTHESPVKDEETEPSTADAHADNIDVQTSTHENATMDGGDDQHEEPFYVEPNHSETETAYEDNRAEDDLSAPQGYNASSGSSTVQGENDALRTGQFDGTFDGDGRLTHYEDGPNMDDTLRQPPTASEDVQSQCDDYAEFDDSLIEFEDDQSPQYEDDSATTHPVYELPSTPKSESRPGDIENQDPEGFVFDLDEGDQQWGLEEQDLDDSQYQDVGDANAPAEDWSESNEQKGTNHDTDLRAAFDVSNPESGTFQVPDESVQDDEDTINYDDDDELDEEEEEMPEPAVIADQAHPSGSPSVKRPREEDHEGGGEDGDDTGSYKRLRLTSSHAQLTPLRLEAAQVELNFSSRVLSDLGFKF